MEQLDALAAKFVEIRSVNKRGRYPNSLKEEVIELTKTTPKAVVISKLGIHENTIYKWKRQLEKSSLPSKMPLGRTKTFIKVKQGPALRAPIDKENIFKISINKVNLSFDDVPDAIWFAKVLKEMSND